jgi:hypothetical protein
MEILEIDLNNQDYKRNTFKLIKKKVSTGNLNLFKNQN